MYRYIFSTLISGLLLLYWIVTVIFITPDNYINIELLEYSDKFNLFFYQRWGFFAPPPKSNDRLYYIFENKKNKSDIKIFEILGPILKEKSRKAPFNSNEDILDYLLSNSVYGLDDEMRNLKDLIEFQFKEKNIKFDKKRFNPEFTLY